MRIVVMLLCLAVIVVVVLYAVGVLGPGGDALTIRVAVDISHSEPILEAFQKETGIELDISYDTEQSKTVGHVMAIIEEQNAGKPRCDVFWNNEIVHTIRLKQMGMLQPYVSPNAAQIPAMFKDPEGYWTGFGARARVFIVNTDLLPDEAARPTSYLDLTNPAYRGRCTLARPETGTTLTHVAALFNEDLLGFEGVKTFLRRCLDNRVQWAASNGQTMRQVRDGNLAFGFTDTDDYNHAVEAGAPVTVVYPDQGEGELGTMVIPNTVSLLKGASHGVEAKRLIDYLLSAEVEAALAKGRSRQIPVRPGVPVPEGIRVPGKDFRAMKVDWEKVATNFDERREAARDVLRAAER